MLAALQGVLQVVGDVVVVVRGAVVVIDALTVVLRVMFAVVFRMVMRAVCRPVMLAAVRRSRRCWQRSASVLAVVALAAVMITMLRRAAALTHAPNWRRRSIFAVSIAVLL